MLLYSTRNVFSDRKQFCDVLIGAQYQINIIFDDIPSRLTGPVLL